MNAETVQKLIAQRKQLDAYRELVEAAEAVYQLLSTGYPIADHQYHIVTALAAALASVKGEANG